MENKSVSNRDNSVNNPWCIEAYKDTAREIFFSLHILLRLIMVYFLYHYLVTFLSSNPVRLQGMCVDHVLPDLQSDKWACKKPADYLDESAHFQDLREDENSASEVTYGEVEQRLGQLQEHLNRYSFLESSMLRLLCI